MDTLHLTSSDNDLKIASQLLSEGEIIAFPTETVYGLGISLDCISYHKLYDLKGRPKQKALTVHLSDIDFVFEFIEDFDDRFFQLAQYFLPGPLTLVMKAKKDLHLPFISDQTIGIRIPSNPIAKRFIQHCGGSIFATSANFSGNSPCVASDEVKTLFANKIAAVVEEGKGGQICKPSTVVSLVDEIKILREGAIRKNEIAKVLQKQKMSV